MHDERFPIGCEVYYRETPYVSHVLCEVVATFHTNDQGNTCFGLELRPIKCLPGELRTVMGGMLPTTRVWSKDDPTGVQVGGVAGWSVSSGDTIAPEVKASLVEIPLP